MLERMDCDKGGEAGFQLDTKILVDEFTSFLNSSIYYYYYYFGVP